MWNLLLSFEAFNINSIPRYLNQEVDLLANVASRLIPSEGMFVDSFSIELLSGLPYLIILSIEESLTMMSN